MPIASSDDDGIVTPSITGFAPKPIVNVSIVDPEYKDVAVDTKNTPISTLLSHLEGALWTVDYYSQVLDTDSPIMSQAITVSAAYQQYKRIKAFQLRVTTPLHQGQDDETKMMTSDGAGLVFAGLIPNEGDMFVADIGVGKPAVFRVTMSSKKSYFKEAAYEIEYALAGADDELLNDLANKTVQELVFRKDLLAFGQSAVIQTSASETINSVQDTIDRLTKQYLEQFFNPEYATLIIGGQTASVYDPFVTQFLSKMISFEDCSLIQHVKVLNVYDDLACRQDNLWTAIENRDATYLKTGFTKTGLVYSTEFTSNPYGGGIRYTGIGCCVYPANPIVGRYGLQAYKIKPLAAIVMDSPPQFNYEADDEYYPWNTQNDPAVGGDLPAQLVDSTAPAPTMYPPQSLVDLTTGVPVAAPVAIKPVNFDAYYVLSADFYNKTETQSLLENAVWAYLDGDAVDPQALTLTAGLVQQWGVLEQFYYIPLLIVLLRYYIRSYQE